MLCIATLKSMTYAMKAQKALSARKISSEIVKIDPLLTKMGCAYGIKFNCMNLEDVKRIFNDKDITYSDIMGGN